MANQKVAKLERGGSCCIPNRSLCVHPWFGISQNISIDPLIGTSFIDIYLCSIFPSERKVFQYYSRPVTVITMMKVIDYVYTDFTVLTWKRSTMTIQARNIVYFALRAKISPPACSQSAVVVILEGHELMTTESNPPKLCWSSPLCCLSHFHKAPIPFTRTYFNFSYNRWCYIWFWYARRLNYCC